MTRRLPPHRDPDYLAELGRVRARLRPLRPELLGQPAERHEEPPPADQRRRPVIRRSELAVAGLVVLACLLFIAAFVFGE